MAKNYILEPVEMSFDQTNDVYKHEFETEPFDASVLNKDAIVELSDGLTLLYGFANQDDDGNWQHFFNLNGDDSYAAPEVTYYPIGRTHAKAGISYFATGGKTSDTVTVSIHTEIPDPPEDPGAGLVKNIVHNDHPYNDVEAFLAKQGDPKTGYNTVEKISNATISGGGGKTGYEVISTLTTIVNETTVALNGYGDHDDPLEILNVPSFSDVITLTIDDTSEELQYNEDDEYWKNADDTKEFGFWNEEPGVYDFTKGWIFSENDKNKTVRVNVTAGGEIVNVSEDFSKAVQSIAPPSPVFMVTMVDDLVSNYDTTADKKYKEIYDTTADKTYKEIYDAFMSGKVCMIKLDTAHWEYYKAIYLITDIRLSDDSYSVSLSWDANGGRNPFAGLSGTASDRIHIYYD